MSLADPTIAETKGNQISVVVNPARAEKLFEGTGHTFAELLAIANSGQALPHFDLHATLRAKVGLKTSQVESQNTAGLFEGSDPKLKNEYVILSAHLDHLGVGQPIDGDNIYNGAMDDASGVASLIEIANYLKQENLKPRRSIIFLAVTGEEKGEQGSKYFSLHPTVKPDSIVADINMDMYLPLFPLKYLEVQGAGESTLGDQVKAACQAAGVIFQADKEPDRNLFIRSDQYSFIRAGIPALSMKVGFELNTPEAAIVQKWTAERYHLPSDDLKQPVDRDAADTYIDVVRQLAVRIANRPDRPQWNQSSFFMRFSR
jgi:Zn-dependent M28 family amino/carboxypeptidase